MPAHVPPVANETGGLLAFLDQQRAAVRTAAFGLTDTEAATSPSASTLSVGGLVKHLTTVERYWTSLVAGRELPRDPDAYFAAFRMAPGDKLAALLDDYRAAAGETGALVAQIGDLSAPVPVPRGVPWLPQDVDAWSLRWVLLHLLTETARHAGHADIVRESLDGASAMSLLAAEECWPENGWLTPWRRSEQLAAQR